MTTHGMSETKTYACWASMKQRCYDSKTQPFKYYGARGIAVCERWNDFRNFLLDMGERPKGMSLDRIDNDGDYCPENCKWSSKVDQMNNTRKNLFIEYNGETKTLAQWSRFLGINKGTLYSRIRNGWTIEKAFNK